MAEHIPGPWASAARQGSSWDLVVYKPGTSLEICQMFHDFTKGNAIGEANARLVSAAPELLNALKAVASRHIDGPCYCDIPNGHTFLSHEPWCTQAREAIAKAEGNS